MYLEVTFIDLFTFQNAASKVRKSFLGHKKGVATCGLRFQSFKTKKHDGSHVVKSYKKLLLMFVEAKRQQE